MIKKILDADAVIITFALSSQSTPPDTLPITKLTTLSRHSVGVWMIFNTSLLALFLGIKDVFSCSIRPSIYKCSHTPRRLLKVQRGNQAQPFPGTDIGYWQTLS